MSHSPILTPLQMLQANSLPSLVQAEIEQMILRSELPVGARVNESDLATRFGTSRGPVREALRALEDGGGFAVSNAEHKAVIKAIASRDADQAGRVLRAHAADSRARVHKAADKAFMAAASK